MLGMTVSAGHGLSGPLYQVDQVPEDYQEIYIIRGYRRPKSSFTQCLLSLFDATNETLNFWTHFLPFWYFIWLVIQFSYKLDFHQDPYTWPFLCYLLTCCVVPFASATAHLFNIVSKKVRHICFFLDYASLSLYSCGCAIVYRAYCFPASILSAEDGSFWCWYRDYFVTISIFNAFVCAVLACQSRFMKPSILQKLMRLGSFAFPYLYDVIPLFVRLFTDQSSLSGQEKIKGAQQLPGDYYHFIQFFLSFLSAFLYASHLPERILPGKFDIFGHSHQLFHVATIVAILVQMQSIVLDIDERRAFLLSSHWSFDSSYKSLGVITFVFVGNFFIILFFALKVFNKTKLNRAHQKSS